MKAGTNMLRNLWGNFQRILELEDRNKKVLEIFRDIDSIGSFQLYLDEEDFSFTRVLKSEGIFVPSTPNLVAVYNRIALLFGHYLFPRGVSIRMNIKRAHGLSSGHAQSLNHFRIFHLRSLKELLKIHKFEILQVKGSYAMLPEKMRFRGIVDTLDKFLHFLNLSYRALICCLKGEEI